MTWFMAFVIPMVLVGLLVFFGTLCWNEVFGKSPNQAPEPPTRYQRQQVIEEPAQTIEVEVPPSVWLRWFIWCESEEGIKQWFDMYGDEGQKEAYAAGVPLEDIFA